jgi:hypothetical protein
MAGEGNSQRGHALKTYVVFARGKSFMFGEGGGV